MAAGMRSVHASGRQYPADPLAIEGYRWLVRYHSSSETRRRQEFGQFAGYAVTEIQLADPKSQQGPVMQGMEAIHSCYTATVDPAGLAKKWYETSIALEPKLAAHGPLFSKDPAMQLCFQAARRQLGNVEGPNRWYTKYMLETAIPSGGPPLTKGADPWRDCVASEIWLANRTIGVKPPKPFGYCPKAQIKPYLDGKLDDPCWEAAKPLPIRTLTGAIGEEYAAEAFFVHDSSHLYIGIRCKHPGGTEVPLAKRRKRDEDLRGHDRVSILIDLDRDYQTYYQLQVDQRGCVCDDCWGDSKWDPTWFAAVESNETEWTAELAIPLLELRRGETDARKDLGSECGTDDSRQRCPGLVGAGGRNTPTGRDGSVAVCGKIAGGFQCSVTNRRVLVSKLIS